MTIPDFNGNVVRKPSRSFESQLKLINLIVDELTRNGVMEPTRLFESPFADHAPTGPDVIFNDERMADIVSTLRQVKANAAPAGVA